MDRFRRPALLCLLILCTWFIGDGPGLCLATCSETEVTAVVIVSDIYPAGNLQIELLAIFPVGELTYPSDEDLAAAVAAIYDLGPPQYYQRIDTQSHYHLYTYSPGMPCTDTIIDLRTGLGEIVVPEAATHTIQIVPGAPAPSPADQTIFPIYTWFEPEWGTLEAINEAAVLFLRQTDLFHGFATCGDYTVVGYTYTPTTGGTDPYVAKQIVLVSGLTTEPWGPIATTHRTWGRVKQMYR